MQTFLQLFQRRLLAALLIFAGLMSSAFLLPWPPARFSHARHQQPTLARTLEQVRQPSRPSRARGKDFFGKLLALGVILVDVGFQDVGVGRVVR